jgi:hypothetical protein
LHELLALIEQLNPKLMQQRRLLDATAAAGTAGDNAAICRLGILEPGLNEFGNSIVCYTNPDFYATQTRILGSPWVQ